MKKYKIQNRVITTNSISKAVRINKILDSLYKDSAIDEMKKRLPDILKNVKNAYKMVLESSKSWIVQVPSDLEYLSNEARKAADMFRTTYRKYEDSVKDSDVEYLSSEEEKAIEDYKKAISNTKDLKLLRLYTHILQEEIEHLEELESEKVEDSIKDNRLSSMTYKKLKELGVKPEQWQKWTQEEANNYIASRSKKESSKKEKTESKLYSYITEAKEYFSKHNDIFSGPQFDYSVDDLPSSQSDEADKILDTVSNVLEELNVKYDGDVESGIEMSNKKTLSIIARILKNSYNIKVATLFKKDTHTGKYGLMFVR